MRLRWLTIVLIGMGLLTACADPEPTRAPPPTPTPEPGAAERPGNEAIYARIDSLESCPALQQELDAATSNAERVRQLEAGDRLLGIALAYAKHADERLHEIGCYD